MQIIISIYYCWDLLVDIFFFFCGDLNVQKMLYFGSLTSEAAAAAKCMWQLSSRFDFFSTYNFVARGQIVFGLR